MTGVEAFIALNRFGLGIGPADVGRLGGDPRGWLEAQIKPDREPPKRLARFPGSATILADIQRARLQGPDALRGAIRRHYHDTFSRELAARSAHQATTPAPFAERMVRFWSNHFSVSRSKAAIGPAIGAYEREAIRPHVFGRFEDLLLAVASHPVMLVYLDNAVSVGPHSFVGRRSKRALNENLARELLELHTVGVDGGYDQEDVTELARALTGWSHDGIGARRMPERISGRFVFRPEMHEPGTRHVLGVAYRQSGAAQARAVLSDLARHPATARFIATKLVRHFVADDPPAAGVEHIAGVFRDTEGNLAAVARALVHLDAAWEDPLAKVKTPEELVVSTLRALDFARMPARAMRGALKTMGQDPFNAPSPQGWADDAAHWVAPESLMRRIEWVRAISARVPHGSPKELLERTLGEAASPATRRMVASAPSPDAGIALVLVSPEFQRR